MRTFAKRPPRISSKTHRLWIGSLACAVSGCMARPEGHHVRWGLYTLSRRPGDDRLVPLCRIHHDELDHGARTFERKYNLDLRLIADTLWVMSPGNPANS
jgi:hypothetical protein